MDKQPTGDGHILTSRETEVFLPSMLAHGRKVAVRGLNAEDDYEYDETVQTLTIRVNGQVAGNYMHRVVVTFDPPLPSLFTVNTFWGDFRLVILAVVAALVAIVMYGVYFS